jgi:pimeloyl-ACP methyl ester carboxylesterase
MSMHRRISEPWRNSVSLLVGKNIRLIKLLFWRLIREKPKTAALSVALAIAVVIAAILGSVWKSDVTVDELKPKYADSSSRFLRIDGMSVHVRDQGRRDDPLPIVLLHGTGSSLHAWDGWTSRLQGKHRVIRLDRPGFGLTGPHPNGDYSMAYYVGFLESLLDRMGVRGPAIIVGNSSGGYMAWRFAAKHPDRVAKLVLIDPAGYPRSTPLPANLLMAMDPRMDIITHHLLPVSQVRKGLEASYGNPSRVTDADVQRYYDITRREGNRAALGPRCASRSVTKIPA